MKTIQLANVPLWKHATGNLTVTVNPVGLGQQLPVSADAIASAKFDAGGKTTLGPADSVQLGIGAGLNVRLAAVFKEQTGAAADLVTEFALAPALTDTNLLLALDIGGKLNFSAAGTYHYSVLSAGATLDAGVDGRVVYARPFPDRTRPATEIIADFISTLQVPASISKPPAPGEVAFLEFGGFLNFGASAAAGYEMKGTRSIDFSQIALSEHYALSVLGKLSVSAKLAGSFTVEVRRSDDQWAAMKVRRKRSTNLAIGADLTVDAELDTEGLPPTGKEFLEALLGLRGKNWINQAQSILDAAAEIKTGDDLVKKLDGLADIYLSKYINKAVGTLLPHEVTDLMTELKKVADSYDKLDDSAISLYDHYAGVAEGALKGALQKLKAMPDWSGLQGEVDPMMWSVMQQLTSGTALNALLGGKSTFDLLQTGVDKALSLLNDEAHSQIRKYLDLAKKEFGLDHLFDLVKKVDTPEHLANTLDDIAKHQAERLIGMAVTAGMSNKDLKLAFQKLTAVVQEVEKVENGFFQKFDAALKAAAKQSFHADFSAAYTASDERDALIDLDIRLLNDDGTASERGRDLMKAAGRGDFSEILAHYDPAVVRLRKGSLTHNLASSSGVKVNVTGWHLDFHYTDSSKVVVNSDQQIRPSGAGMLNVFTTVDMSVERDKTRKTSHAEQEMHSNFTLRFLAETNGIVDGTPFDEHDQQYLLDVITRQSAVYTNVLKDSNVNRPKLDAMLALGRLLGLDKAGANDAALMPLVQPDSAGSFGAGEAGYTVTFAESGLKALFAAPIDDDEIKQVLRTIVLSQYVGAGSNMQDIAWMFCSDVANQLALGDGNFVKVDGILGDVLDDAQKQLRSPIPGIAPKQLHNNQTVRQFADTLFRMQETLIGAFHKLQEVVNAKKKLSLHDLEKALNGFGKALSSFNGQSQLSDTMPAPTFIVIDQLVKLASPGQMTRDSALALSLGAHQFVFQLQAPKAGAAAV